MSKTTAAPDAMLRFADVIARTGLSRTTLWRKIRVGDFPAPVQLGPNSVGFSENSVSEWVASRPQVTYAADPEAAAA